MECEHAAGMVAAVLTVMAPVGGKDSSAPHYYPSVAVAAYNILRQAYVHPIGGKLPDIQEQHIYGLRKRLCLIDGTDIEAQDQILAISCQKCWRRTGDRGSFAISLWQACVRGNAPDGVNEAVSGV